MEQDALKIQQSHEKFIKEICETGVVWGLEKDEEFATSISDQYEDEDGEAIEMICVWSDKASAIACAKDDWTDHTPMEIPLADFIEKWCLGMDDDGLMVGTNFDENLFGTEADPLELIVEIYNELKKTKKPIRLENYDNLGELVKEIKTILEE